MIRTKDSYIIMEDPSKPETVGFWGCMDEPAWHVDSVDTKMQARIYRGLAAHMLVEAHHHEVKDENGVSETDADTGDILRQIMKMLEEHPEFREEAKGRIFFGL